MFLIFFLTLSVSRQADCFFHIREAFEGETQKVGEEVIDKENSLFERVNNQPTERDVVS